MGLMVRVLEGKLESGTTRQDINRAEPTNNMLAPLFLPPRTHTYPNRHRHLSPLLAPEFRGTVCVA
jgi:hypothetical protein